MSLLISLYMRYLEHFKHDVLITHNFVSILNEKVNKSDLLAIKLSTLILFTQVGLEAVWMDCRDQVSSDSGGQTKIAVVFARLKKSKS